MIHEMVAPTDPLGPPPSSRKVRIQGGDRPTGGQGPREAAPDEQPAERDDERRDADEGDQEALQAADGRADEEAGGQRR